MQKVFIIILLFLSTHCVAQDATRFEIEQKPKPENLLPETFKQSVFASYQDKIEKNSITQDSLVSFGDHSFLVGILKAYQEHRPFVLSPDIIWLLINQGFAKHVGNNAEALRSKLVQFNGKKTLTVASQEIRLGDPKSNWESVFPQFTKQIDDYIDKGLTNTLTANFSTTTSTSLIASQITIMDAMQAYFNYKVLLVGCGIPTITIEGSVQDWESVLVKTKTLAKYDLQWWTNELEPILSKIIEAKQGRFDKKFWMNMVKVHTAKKYGSPTTIDGWIVKFFPYTKEGKKTGLKPITKISDLASEIVKVPFILEDPIAGKQYKMEFWAGFAGLSQNKTDYTLNPEIGWAVVNKNSPAINASYNDAVEDLSISNVDEVPDKILSIKSIGILWIFFNKDIHIPDELAKINIKKLELSGKIDPTEARKIKALFPTTVVSVNGTTLMPL
ncbi:MAG: DUF4419 domain-containing protein [Filimonas sp.]|nr:DUF4419 domain-containing protein [Filimonas sp.]